MVRHTAPKRILCNNLAVPRQKSEQRRLIARLDSLSVLCQNLESIYHQNLNSLSDLKQSILRKAFTCELIADPSTTSDALKEVTV